jgi:hypothetical protein
MSCDLHPPLRDVTANTENTEFSTVACWAVFAELLPSNALIKLVIILLLFSFCKSFWVNYFKYLINVYLYIFTNCDISLMSAILPEDDHF